MCERTEVDQVLEDACLEALGAGAVSEVSREFNFGEGFTETWEIVYPCVDDWSTEACQDWLRDRGYGLLEDVDEENAEETWRDEVTQRMQDGEDYAPMMNYLYPLPGLDHEPAKAQTLIEDTNCVVVLVQDPNDDYPATPYLALAGGGMDLSWDICLAYIRLGYLPPLHFCELPEYAGKTLDPTRRLIVAACLKTCEVAGNWAMGRAERLKRLRVSMARITPGQQVRCGNCDWVGAIDDAARFGPNSFKGGNAPKPGGEVCNEIRDLAERVEAGAEVPAGECPKCGALCYLD